MLSIPVLLGGQRLVIIISYRLVSSMAAVEEIIVMCLRYWAKTQYLRN
ncbi:MAG: hypothetical protein ABG776_14155 [Cyanobacteria bacterium J06555_13]